MTRAARNETLPGPHNNWSWYGPCEDRTHRYHQVMRDYRSDTIWCYQTDDAFHASSAAYIFVANDIGPFSETIEGVGVVVSSYDIEDAAHWFNRACDLGIVFG